MFGGMMPGMMPGAGMMPGMGMGMNPMSMMGGMNPMSMMSAMMPQAPQPQVVQPAAPVLNTMSSVDTINRAILQGLTKVHTAVGEKEGTLSTMLLNSGLTTDQLDEAIQMYKSRLKQKPQSKLEEI